MQAEAGLDDELFGVLLEIEKHAAALPKHLVVPTEKWAVKLSSCAGNYELRKERNAYAHLLLERVKKKRLDVPFDRLPEPGPLPRLPSYLKSQFHVPMRRRAWNSVFTNLSVLSALAVGNGSATPAAKSRPQQLLPPSHSGAAGAAASAAASSEEPEPIDSAFAVAESEEPLDEYEPQEAPPVVAAPPASARLQQSRSQQRPSTASRPAGAAASAAPAAPASAVQLSRSAGFRVDDLSAARAQAGVAAQQARARTPGSAAGPASAQARKPQLQGYAQQYQQQQQQQAGAAAARPSDSKRQPQGRASPSQQQQSPAPKQAAGSSLADRLRASAAVPLAQNGTKSAPKQSASAQQRPQPQQQQQSRHQYAQDAEEDQEAYGSQAPLPYEDDVVDEQQQQFQQSQARAAGASAAGAGAGPAGVKAAPPDASWVPAAEYAAQLQAVAIAEQERDLLHAKFTALVGETRSDAQQLSTLRHELAAAQAERADAEHRLAAAQQQLQQHQQDLESTKHLRGAFATEQTLRKQLEAQLAEAQLQLKRERQQRIEQVQQAASRDAASALGATVRTPGSYSVPAGRPAKLAFDLDLGVNTKLDIEYDENSHDVGIRVDSALPGAQQDAEYRALMAPAASSAALARLLGPARKPAPPLPLSSADLAEINGTASSADPRDYALRSRLPPRPAYRGEFDLLPAHEPDVAATIAGSPMRFARPGVAADGTLAASQRKSAARKRVTYAGPLHVSSPVRDGGLPAGEASDADGAADGAEDDDALLAVAAQGAPLSSLLPRSQPQAAAAAKDAATAASVAARPASTRYTAPALPAGFTYSAPPASAAAAAAPAAGSWSSRATDSKRQPAAAEPFSSASAASASVLARPARAAPAASAAASVSHTPDGSRLADPALADDDAFLDRVNQFQARSATLLASRVQ